MSMQTIFKNATIVLREEVVRGTVALADGKIQDIASGPSCAPGMDLEGDMLLPGLVELHTDHLESHLQPRPKVRWPAASAIAAFDAQIAASGITTVFDCIRTGREFDSDIDEREDVLGVVDALSDAKRRDTLRVDHRLHVRCEVCADSVVELTDELLQRYPVHLMSLMDHTPGARQFRALDTWRTYYGGKTGLTNAEIDELMVRKATLFDRNYGRHRQRLVQLANEHAVVLASHDDTTVEHVDEFDRRSLRHRRISNHVGGCAARAPGRRPGGDGRTQRGARALALGQRLG